MFTFNAFTMSKKGTFFENLEHLDEFVELEFYIVFPSCYFTYIKYENLLFNITSYF